MVLLQFKADGLVQTFGMHFLHFSHFLHFVHFPHFPHFTGHQKLFSRLGVAELILQHTNGTDG